MPIPFKLDYVIEELVKDGESERQAIKRLTGVRLPAPKAFFVWRRILDHKWYISERLGRDTGLKVAAIDYFENIYQAPRASRRNGWLQTRLRMICPRNAHNNAESVG
jgi:hypothetical protein